MKKIVVTAAITLLVLANSMAVGQTMHSSGVDWPFYAGDPGSMHYSTLADVNKGNVSRLQQAWMCKTGETPLKEYGATPGMFEDTPLMIDDVLYVTTPYNRVVALNADTGAEIWTYDPKTYAEQVGALRSNNGATQFFPIRNRRVASGGGAALGAGPGSAADR